MKRFVVKHLVFLLLTLFAVSFLVFTQVCTHESPERILEVGVGSDSAGELHIGDAAVVLQLFENPAVDGVETGGHEMLRRVGPARIISGVAATAKDYCASTVPRHRRP